MTFASNITTVIIAVYKLSLMYQNAIKNGLSMFSFIMTKFSGLEGILWRGRVSNGVSLIDVLYLRSGYDKLASTASEQTFRFIIISQKIGNMTSIDIRECLCYTIYCPRPWLI